MFSAFKKLFFLFDQRTRLQFLMLFTSMLVCAVFQTVGIALIVPFITVIEDPGMIQSNEWFRRIHELFGTSNSKDFLIYFAIGMLIFYVIKNAFIGVMNYLQSRFILSKRAALARKLFLSYMKSPFTFHLERNRAEFLRNMDYSVTHVYWFVRSFITFSTEVCFVTSIVIMLLLVNPLIVICSVSFMGGISLAFHKAISGHSKMLGEQVQSSQKDLGQAVLEGFGAIKEVKIAGKEAFFPSRYYTDMMKNARANWRQTTINSMPTLFLEVVAVGSVVLIIIILLQIQGQQIKVLLPTLSLFAIATIRLTPSVSRIVSSLQQFRFFTPALEIIYEEFQLFGKLNAAKQYVFQRSDKSLRLNKEIRVENLSYIYPNSNEKALRGVSLEILKGEAIALAGPSGAGKTTLANVILGLLKPSEGCILVDKYDVFQDLPAWHRNIGYVPQSVYLMDASIRNNVAFALSEHEIADTKVWEALKLAQLEGFVKQLPRGLDTFVGENGVRLSGGQRQRLGIARAAFHQPEILILDEATSALDNETEMEVSQAIEALSGKKTVIIIAHRLSTIRKCNRIYYMEKGAIVASGTFEELLLSSQKFQAMKEIGKY